MLFIQVDYKGARMEIDAELREFSIMDEYHRLYCDGTFKDGITKKYSDVYNDPDALMFDIIGELKRFIKDTEHKRCVSTSDVIPYVINIVDFPGVNVSIDF